MVKVTLFLGAGSSVPFGMLTTSEFKEYLKDKYGKDPLSSFTSGLLNCPDFPDIEYFLQALKDINVFLNSHGGVFFKYLGTINGLKFYTRPDLGHYSEPYFH